METALLKLFRAVEVDVKKSRKRNLPDFLLKKTIENGFILDQKIVSTYPNSELEELINRIIKVVGINGRQLNQSFHKSWSKVKNAPIQQLLIEQIMHYFTTYSFEELGVYNENTVYIPNEELNIPDLKEEKISLILIKGYTLDEIKKKTLSLLSGIALKEETIKLVLDIIPEINLTEEEIANIKNKEVKITLYDKLGIVPENPVEMLRYMIYKVTGETLLIKNNALIAKIKAGSFGKIPKLFFKYVDTYGIGRLASIFLRFKPLFLAFKVDDDLKPVINKLRKLADTYRRPMPKDFLNDVTRVIRRGYTEDWIKLKLDEELPNVNIFRKVRLAYSLKYASSITDSILYKIRNGKSFAKEFNFNEPGTAKLILNEVLKSIVNDIKPKVNKKKIYIPDGITYPIPATEKQFIGMFPSGTCVTVSNDMVLGIHWENIEHNRIDLDLSLTGAGVKFGWDARYRDHERTILFSGDMTDANKGATEAYFINKLHEGSYILFNNYYNFDDEIPVPFKIFIASENVRSVDKNYTVDPNNVIAITDAVMNTKQKMLGLLVVDKSQAKFFFTETSLGKTITSSNKDWTEHARKYLLSYNENMIDMKEVLVMAGAKMVTDPLKADIDLSSEKLEKDSFLNILQG